MVLVLLLVAAPTVFPMGAVHPKGPITSPQWPPILNELVNHKGRVYGYFYGRSEYFFFAGDTQAFNEFVARYAQLKDTSLTLTLRLQRGMAGAWWEKEKTTSCDWYLTISRPPRAAAASADSATTATEVTVALCLYLGGQVALRELKVPLNVEVRSGGAMERFIKEHEARRAAGPASVAALRSQEAISAGAPRKSQLLPDIPFAIHLLQATSETAAEAIRSPLDELPLQKEPLLTLDDFTSYSWKDHSFGLTPAAEKKIPSPRSVFGMPFVVASHGKRLYLGAFWTSVSSASFTNPVIDVFECRLKRRWQIARAYPGTGVGEPLEDPRANPAIKEAFEKAGKLK
jgi:hypothetical protein